MKLILNYLACALVLGGFSSHVLAEPLPIFSNNSGVDSALLEKIEKLPFFTDLSRSYYGSPYTLTIRIGDHSTQGGTAAELTSIILAGSTLGVVPVVSNSDVTITYEIWVNRRTYVEYGFTKNFSDVDAFWALDQTEMDPDVLEWALTTVDEMAAMIDKDPKIAALIEKHEQYYME